MGLSQANVLGAGVEAARRLAVRAASRAPAAADSPRERHLSETAATVCAQLPWAAVTFLATYAAVAVFELHLHPERWGTYVPIYLVGALECAVAVALTRSPSIPPKACLVITTALGLGLILNTTVYHILVRGEAEVLAIGNLYLMIGFLAAFPWGGWPQVTIALAACAGLAIGLLTTVSASVSSGILLSGMASLGGMSVASAVFTDRYRYKLLLVQEELQAATEAAERASRARRDFVASVSHELRTPVNILFGMADMALDAAPTAEQRELIESIKRATVRLHALTDDLLDFSRIDAGVVALAPRRFALRPWIDATLEAHRREAAAKGVRLATAVDAALPEAIVADPDRLGQVLGNLVGNAVKFTDAGEVTVRLELASGAARAAVRCAVTDTGIGISAEDSARLFEPFAQAEAIGRSYAGSGLGLAICRRLVEQMGGRIGLHSVVGCGSTFWFTVPLA